MTKPQIKTIVSNNCFGITTLHKLNMQFKNPMMNLWLFPVHYIQFISNFRENIQKEIVFSDSESAKYGHPVGYIDDMCLYFTHYHSKEEVVSTWQRRAARLPASDDEILFQISERDGFSQQDFMNFCNLPYANKLVVCVNKSNYSSENTLVLETGENGHEVNVGSVLADQMFDQVMHHYDFV